MVSTGSCNLSSYSLSFLSHEKSIQSISLFGPAMQPSTDIATCSFNFLIAFLLSTIYSLPSNSSKDPALFLLNFVDSKKHSCKLGLVMSNRASKMPNKYTRDQKYIRNVYCSLVYPIM